MSNKPGLSLHWFRAHVKQMLVPFVFYRPAGHRELPAVMPEQNFFQFKWLGIVIEAWW